MLLDCCSPVTCCFTGHPASKKSDTDFKWEPPKCGFIGVSSIAWDILQSWVRDPQCLSKFKYYIDNLSTAMCECWNAKKLRWLPKLNHFPRFYSNGINCAIIDHNENATRELKFEKWMRGDTLRKGGRWYTTRVREAPTDAWRGRILQA